MSSDRPETGSADPAGFVVDWGSSPKEGLADPGPDDPPIGPSGTGADQRDPPRRTPRRDTSERLSTDEVIQRIYRTGLHLHAALTSATAAQLRAEIQDVFDELDLLIDELRQTALTNRVHLDGFSETFPHTVETATLDETGTIVSVNEAWKRFCQDNDGQLENCGEGTSYLDVCYAAGDLVSIRVAAAIRSALAGNLLPPHSLLVPCHSPRRQRWYDVAVYPRINESGRALGATVAVWQVADTPPAPPSDQPSVTIESLLRDASHRIDAISTSSSHDATDLQLEDARQAVHRALIAIAQTEPL